MDENQFQHGRSVFGAISSDKAYDILWDEMHADPDDGRELIWLVRENTGIVGALVISYLSYNYKSGSITDHHCRYMFTKNGWEPVPVDERSIAEAKQRMIPLKAKTAQPYFSALLKVLKSKNREFNSGTLVKPSRIQQTANISYPSNIPGQTFQWPELDFEEIVKNKLLNYQSPPKKTESDIFLDTTSDSAYDILLDQKNKDKSGKVLFWLIRQSDIKGMFTVSYIKHNDGWKKHHCRFMISLLGCWEFVPPDKQSTAQAEQRMLPLDHTTVHQYLPAFFEKLKSINPDLNVSTLIKPSEIKKTTDIVYTEYSGKTFQQPIQYSQAYQQNSRKTDEKDFKQPPGLARIG